MRTADYVVISIIVMSGICIVIGLVMHEATMSSATWQPIATAPENEVILGYEGGIVEPVVNHGGQWLCSRPSPGLEIKPTHWVPMPEMP